MNDAAELKNKLKHSLDTKRLIDGQKFGILFHITGAMMLACLVLGLYNQNWSGALGWLTATGLWIAMGFIVKMLRVRGLQATLLLQLLDNVEIVDDSEDHPSPKEMH